MNDTLPKGRFTRKKEDFTCERCGAQVTGTGYTDHCPSCLVSKHVDKMPGDRENKCKGVMKPISAEYRNGSYIIYYKCEKCGLNTHVTANEADNKAVLESLISRR